MHILVGTSGYAYREWVGAFYPRATSSKRMLAEYAARLPTVEANSTFRELPSAEDVARWVADVPRGFVFSLKAPQLITHMRRLRGCAGDVAALLETQAALGRHRGPLLFQLPPSFKADFDRLRAFLALLPRRARAAFEFRHPSWFEGDAVELGRTLRRAGAALCIAEDDDFATPFVTTAPFGYLRLRRSRYTKKTLAAWAARVAAAPWREAYVYVRHDDRAPRWARQLQAHLPDAAATR